MSSKSIKYVPALCRHLLLNKVMKLKKFLICAACFLSLTGCGKRNITSDLGKYTDRNVFAMDTFMTMRAYGDNGEDALKKAEKKITDLESMLSVTSENSDIQRINSSDGTPVQVSDETAEIISQAVKFGDETDGALDITLYSVLRAWGFTSENFRIPGDDELAGLLKNVDYSRVAVDGDIVTIPADFQIDLGSVAKGYTSDAVIDVLRENGVKSAVVSLGGNVQTLGKKPDGSQWKVAVRNPFVPDRDMCVLEIGESAVITSGNYERFFTGDDGKKYWHILDSADGYPADNGLVSVTIIGDSCLYCDALSTALFVMGTDDAVKFWREKQDFDMILVTDTGEIIYTNSNNYTLKNLSDMPAEVISND